MAHVNLGRGLVNECSEAQDLPETYYFVGLKNCCYLFLLLCRYMYMYEVVVVMVMVVQQCVCACVCVTKHKLKAEVNF